MTDERLAVINARKNGRVCSMDADIINRPGPRIVEALEAVAHCLQPDLF
jgi:iron complex transport system substrate-binding protein